MAPKHTLNGEFTIAVQAANFSGDYFNPISGGHYNFLRLEGQGTRRAMKFTLVNNKLVYVNDNKKIIEWHHRNNNKTYMLFTDEVVHPVQLVKFQARYRCSPVTHKLFLALEFAHGYRNNCKFYRLYIYIYTKKWLTYCSLKSSMPLLQIQTLDSTQISSFNAVLVRNAWLFGLTNNLSQIRD